MKTNPSFEELEAGKKALTALFSHEPWCHGVGIARTNQGRLGLRVNVSAGKKVPATIPRSFNGIDVEIVGIVGYRARTKAGNIKRSTDRSLISSFQEDVGQSQSFLTKLSDLLEEEVRGWKTDEREWSRLSFRRLRDSAFEACVIRKNARKSNYTICISDGLALELRRNFRAVITQEDFFRVIWQRRIDSTRTSVVVEDMRGWLAENTAFWVDRFTTFGVRFVLNHEIAHVIRGHLYHDRSNPAWGGVSGYSEITAGFADRRTAALWRSFEIDADQVGADLFSQTTILGTWTNENRTIRRQFCSLLMFSVGMTLLTLERAKRSHGCHGPTIYQPPFIRFLMVIDVLGASLSRELNLGKKSLAQAAQSSIGLLRSATRFLGYGHRTWGAGDSSSWTKALETRDKALGIHLPIIENMLRNRSTLFPHGASGGYD